MSYTFSEYLKLQPYELAAPQKRQALQALLGNLTLVHAQNCVPYRHMLEALDFRTDCHHTLEDLPFLPVRLFKELKLKSCPDSEIVKTMYSSGTTSQKRSVIYLDIQTADAQQQVFASIVSSYLGKQRLPMLIIDTQEVIRNRQMFSARGAGILGFSLFGSPKFFCLKEDLSLDLHGLEQFLSEHQHEKIFIFGFTFMIWQHFYQELLRLKDTHHVNLSNAILMHGGGWKKLAAQAVSPAEFKFRLQELLGLSEVYNFYGMVEQTGCIYMECPYGHLHASIFSEILIRNPNNFEVCPPQQEGIVELISCLPHSYPGHCLLTEDLGVLLGEDDCPCGRKGKYFKLNGRLKQAELRGCSDTYEQRT